MTLMRKGQVSYRVMEEVSMIEKMFHRGEK